MSNKLYEEYLKLDIDTALFNLEKGNYPEYYGKRGCKSESAC